MGLGRLIHATGEYDFYTADHQQFVPALAHRLQANINLHVHDSTGKTGYSDKQDQLFPYHYPVTYQLFARYSDYNLDDPETPFLHCIYEMDIPLHLRGAIEFSLEWLPNGLFVLSPLPFNSTWWYFIYDLLGKHDAAYPSQKELVAGILEVRHQYKNLLAKINCTEVLLFTEANYKTEHRYLFNHAPGRKTSLTDLKQQFPLLDQVTLYDFMDVLHQRETIPDKEMNFFDVVLVDRLMHE